MSDESNDTSEVEPENEATGSVSPEPESDASETAVAGEAEVEADAQSAESGADVETAAEIENDADEAEADADEDEPGQPAPTRTRAGTARRDTPPAPARKRDRKRDPNAPKPVVRAQAKYVRSSARKARLVCDNFRGKTVVEARAILAVTPRAVAQDWSKLLESAVANAEHNHDLVGEDLVVKSVQADEGPTIKRFRPRAQGRATRIRKRTSHLTILLTPKD
jgi:ribosomal protein L22